jgi:hypothetical protein
MKFFTSGTGIFDKGGSIFEDLLNIYLRRVYGVQVTAGASTTVEAVPGFVLDDADVSGTDSKLNLVLISPLEAAR